MCPLIRRCARVLAAVVGAGTPIGFRGLRRQHGRAARRGRPHRRPGSPGVALCGHRPRATWAWPGPTWRATSTSRATSFTTLEMLARRPRGRADLARAPGGAARPRAVGPASRSPRPRGGPARACGGACATRCRATPGPSATTTTCPIGSTSGSSGRRWPTRARSTPTSDATLEEAQEEKVDLVCRKLDLQPGQRLLDVGCGWGTMVLHAARHYGVQVIGVTLSRQQAEYGQKRIAELGSVRRGRDPPRRLPQRHRDRLRRHQQHRPDRAHRGQEPGALRPLPRLQAAAPGPAAQPLHHPADDDRAGRGPAGSSTATSSPTASSRRSGPSSRPCRTPASRSATRRTSASTTPAPARRGAPTWTRTGTRPSPRLARAGPGCGGSTWPDRGSGFTQRRIELHQVLAIRSDGGDAAIPLRPNFARQPVAVRAFAAPA